MDQFRQRDVDWNETNVGILTTMWANGFSCSAIASKIPCATRSGVIGKVHRLKLPHPAGKHVSSANHRPRAAKPEARPFLSPPPAPRLRNGHDPSQRRNPSHNIEAAIAIAGSEPGLPKRLKGEAPDGTGIKLIDLTDATCHWPRGNPTDENFEFCGGHALKGLPYCKHHSQIAYVPSSRAMRGV